ncbi:hypothetical protein Vadar_005359 [Vaccinium darrowii]|uniref:Uncharacterized protein n=1 Tax=Vaccinium darrowii TaxID=229202 RepID=A0ACB7WY92_9ERIC|nr:hypothetical protein Vadar_005359 [Vaccinium darrowii]
MSSKEQHRELLVLKGQSELHWQICRGSNLRLANLQPNSVNKVDADEWIGDALESRSQIVGMQSFEEAMRDLRLAVHEEHLFAGEETAAAAPT